MVQGADGDGWRGLRVRLGPRRGVGLSVRRGGLRVEGRGLGCFLLSTELRDGAWTRVQGRNARNGGRRDKRGRTSGATRNDASRRGTTTGTGAPGSG